MIILVFDTSLDKMYVSLANDDKILDSRVVTNKDNKYHSAFLISTIRAVLKENGLTPSNIDAIGTNIGPGSFTGIRACTTVARIMAQQLNIPAVGVSSLEILKELVPSGKNPLVALDARKGSAYLYAEGKIQGAVSIEDIEKKIETNKYDIITDDKLLNRLGGISYQQKDYPLGEILAFLTYKKLQNTKCDWRELKPLYIQPPPGV